MAIKLRLYSNDGRSEMIELNDGARVSDLREIIGNAFFIGDDDRGRVQIRVYKSFEKRLDERMRGDASSLIHNGPFELNELNCERSLSDVNIVNLSTVVVENCDALSSRSMYTTVRKIIAMKQKSSPAEQRALRLLRTMLTRIVIDPHDQRNRKVTAAPVRSILTKADCFGILSHLGAILQGESFILDRVDLVMLRIIVRNLYDSNEEWEEVEAAAISSRPPPTQEPASRPTYNLRPKPADPALKNALPDYSRAVWSVIGCLVIAVIAMHWLRSQPMTVAAPTHQTATLIEKTDVAAATEDHLKAEHLHPHISEDNMQIAR